ncbi:MAG: hypothetical protein RSE14_03460 [Erythrobacter sp.]|jgi:hypothetical protein|uniref:hypothetical protein n=1 Tax=Erythrobacter sp. TaxID=1042 RepID=UPI002B48FF42|nr:hypothetical protein [Erythrobacter sp.]WRH71165.1 MAG: hypothetical protein RSE14_03460 [Erythrobacter sp.]
MCLRTSSPLALLGLLAACTSESPPPPGDEIECAIGAGADFSAVCTLERVSGTQTIILHHPDGGFRRLSFDPASGTIAAIDGADPVVPEAGEGVMQFAVGADRYRLPRGPAPTPGP